MASLEHSGLCSSEEAQGKDASCFRHVVQNQCSVVVAIESRVDCNSKGYLGILDKEDRSINTLIVLIIRALNFLGKVTYCSVSQE